MENISVVKIQLDMIADVARLHMAAFEGYTNTRIGLPYVRAFIRWFCITDDAIALCAVDNAKTPLGYVVGAPLGYGTNLNRTVFWPAVGGILLRPWLAFDTRSRVIAVERLCSLIKRKTSYVSNVPILPSPTISLVGIGVDPQARGKKVGQKLMAVFESCVIEAKAKSMRLSVYPDKVAACKLYQKAGWQPFISKNTPTMYYYKIIG